MQHMVMRLVCLATVAGLGFGAMADVPLPEGYMRVEYLASTDGKPFVNTGFKVTTNEWEYVLDAQLDNNNMYGGANWDLEWQANVFGGKRHVFHYWRAAGGVKREWWLDNGAHTSIGAQANPAQTYMAILALGGTSATSGYITGQTGKVYEFWLYRDQELVQHLVPVVNADGEAFFFDLVTGADFKSMSSSGVFQHGASFKIGKPFSPQLHTGEPLEPEIVLLPLDDGPALVAGEDYEVTYSNNTDVGTGYGVVRGIGRYEGNDPITLTFPIVARVEYIKGTGAQCLSTGVTVDYDTEYEYVLDARIDTSGGGYCGANQSMESQSGLFGGLRHVLHNWYLQGVNKQWIDSGTKSTRNPGRNGIGNLIAILGMGSSATTVGYKESGEVYEFWLYVNGELVQHLVPVLCDDEVKGVRGALYDLVNETLHENVGSGVLGCGANFTVDPIPTQKFADGPVEPELTVRDFMTGRVLRRGTDYEVTYSDNTAVGVGKAHVVAMGSYIGDVTLSFTIHPSVTGVAAVPEKYTPVAYLESDGTACANTGFRPTAGTWDYILDAQLANNGRWGAANVSMEFQASVGGGNRHLWRCRLASDNRHTIRFDESETLVVNRTPSGGRNSLIFVLGLGNDGGRQDIQSGKVWSFQLLHDGELVCELVPILDDQGVACFYDTMAGKCVYSAGTGPFTSGPNLTVDPIDDQFFGGTAVSPAVTVRDFRTGEVLDATEYDVVYSDNEAFGTGIATVTGKNAHFGTVQTSFRIVGAYFVKADAVAGEGDGTSFATAYTFAEAVERAQTPGDTILCKAGVYEIGATVALAAPVNVRGGYAGTDSTTLDATGALTEFRAGEGVTVPVRVTADTAVADLNGFVRCGFTHGTEHGLVKTGKAGISFEKCRFACNGADDRNLPNGRGILLTGTSSSTASFVGCSFEGNAAAYAGSGYASRGFGYGLNATTWMRVTFEDCLFATNGVAWNVPTGAFGTQNRFEGAAAYLNSAPAHFRNCRFLANRTVERNTSDDCRGGVVYIAGSPGTTTFSNCLFAANWISAGTDASGWPAMLDRSAVIAVDTSSTAASLGIDGCTFAYNCCDAKSGPCVLANNGAVKVRNSIFWGMVKSAATTGVTLFDARGYSTFDVDYTILQGTDGEAVRRTDTAKVLLGENVWTSDPAFVSGADAFGRFCRDDGTGRLAFDPALIGEWTALDLHVRSQAGHRLNDGTWTSAPGVYSPAVDTADPASGVGDEPAPNGGRRNLGCYGGTAEASKTGADAATVVSAEDSYPRDGISVPRLTVRLGGAAGAQYNATVTIAMGTNRNEYVTCRTLSGIHAGDAVFGDFAGIATPGETVYYLVTVDVPGRNPVYSEDSFTCGGKYPGWIGHGGGPTVLHVWTGGFGTGDGSNWNDACRTLADAIARWNDRVHREIWIAGTCGVERTTTLVTRTPMAIRGGFTGYEDTAAERPAEGVAALDANQAVDILDLSTLTDAPVEIERVAFVRAAKNGLKCQLGAPLTLNACRFEENGQVAAGAAVNGRGVLASGNSTLVISNCLFRNNFAASLSTEGGYGAGLYASGLSALQVVDTDFVQNGIRLTDAVGSHTTGGDRSTRGAAVYLDGVRGGFVRCAFRANRCVYINSEGGVVKLAGACGGSAFTNCVFAGNENSCGWSFNYNPGDSNSRASTVVLELGQASATVDFVNCSFVRNLTGGVKAVGGIACVKGRAFVRNCLFWDNLVNKSSTTAKDIYLTAEGQADVDWCAFERADGSCVYAENPETLSFPTENVVTNDPLLVRSCPLSYVTYGSNIVPYFSLTQAALDAALAIDVHVRKRSPAIDAGDPKSPYKAEPRPCGWRVNLGAYGNTSEATTSPAGTALIVR